MAGQKTVLDGITFTDTTLPILRSDALLSAGFWPHSFECSTV
ncbi:hypothetical protein [Pseudomonas sp. AM8]|nr:hypothetical protein [Pseudomonas sp. AM8]